MKVDSVISELHVEMPSEKRYFAENDWLSWASSQE